MKLLNKLPKLDLSIAQIVSFFVVLVVCILAYISISNTQQQLNNIATQNEQIQVKLSKTKTNTDLQKLLAEYHINNANYSKHFMKNKAIG